MDFATAQIFRGVRCDCAGRADVLEDLKPSTRQRFVAIEFDFPPAQREAEIVAHESGVDQLTAERLVKLGRRVRNLCDHGVAEVPSTRLLVATARLVFSDIPIRDACRTAFVAPLSDGPTLLASIGDLLDATLWWSWRKPKNS